MTPEEVIKTLEVAKAEVEWNYPMDYAVAIDEAIKAMEKQIPKKPVSKYKYRDGENVCPSCETENRCRIVMFWEKFCPDCGQAIGWEAKEWQS